VVATRLMLELEYKCRVTKPLDLCRSPLASVRALIQTGSYIPMYNATGKYLQQHILHINYWQHYTKYRTADAEHHKPNAI